MLHKHQAFFVFLDFILSVCMLVITVLALNGFFNKTIEINSCPAPVVSSTPLPSASVEASSSATPEATTTGLRKIVK